MNKIILNDKIFKVEGKDKTFELNGMTQPIDIIRVSDHTFHVLYNSTSYNIELLGFDAAEKTYQLKINGKKISTVLKDRYDELLHNLGLDAVQSKKINDIKAPMPGMVINVLVQEGQAVKKGDALIILEAMKMENILKSPHDGTIKKISVQKGVAVEKNQVLIHF